MTLAVKDYGAIQMKQHSAMLMIIIWMSFLPINSKACNPGCGGLGKCDEKGVCTEGCKAGYFGTYCQNECVAYCGGNGSKCDRWTGHCSEGCDPGFYGDMCLSVCSINCAGNGSCNSQGHCDDGCKAGYTGLSCTEVCANATFGKNCQHQCACKNNLECNRMTGLCPNYQCADGRVELACYRILPKLSHSPTLLSKNCNNITIIWRAFDENVDSGFGPVGQYNVWAKPTYWPDWDNPMNVTFLEPNRRWYNASVITGLMNDKKHVFRIDVVVRDKGVLFPKALPGKPTEEILNDCRGLSTGQPQIKTCPVGTYKVEKTDRMVYCLACHSSCHPQHPCDGPLGVNCRVCRNGSPKPPGSVACPSSETGPKVEQKNISSNAVSQTCSPGTYRFVRADNAVFCEACHPTCSPDHMCDGPLTENCRVCWNGQTKPTGLATCPRVSEIRKTVKQSCSVSPDQCPVGTYCKQVSVNDVACEKCHVYCDHSYKCKGPTPYDCLYCKSGLIKHPGARCTGPPPCWVEPRPCAVGTYCNEKADYTTTCPSCHESCHPEYQCDGPLPEQCQVCRNGARKPPGFVPCLRGDSGNTKENHGKSSCVVSPTNCPVGKYCRQISSHEKTCEKCHVYCDPNYICTGPTPFDCLRCKDGLMRQPGARCTGPPLCWVYPRPCTAGTYCQEKENFTITCQACHVSCDPSFPCDGPQPEDCIVCKGGLPKPLGSASCTIIKASLNKSIFISSSDWLLSSALLICVLFNLCEEMSSVRGCTL